MEFGTARCTPPTAPAFQVSRFFGSRWRRVAGHTGVGTARCTPPTAPAFRVSRFPGSRWRRVASHTGDLYRHCHEQARVFLGPAASGLAAATPLLSHANLTAHALRLPLSHTAPHV